MLRLPDVEEPAVRLAFQTFDLFTELDGTFNRAIDQTLTSVPFIIAAAVSVDATIP